MGVTTLPFSIDTAEAWTVHPGLNRLSGPRGDLQLEPRVMRLLICLVEAKGAPVSREELLDAVWGGDTFVSEGSLTLAISELRRILGDEPRTPRYIETIRKVGYRWLPETHESVGALEDATGQSDGTTMGDGLRTAPAAGRLARPMRVAALVLAAVVVWALVRAPQSSTRTPESLGSPVPVTSLPGMEVSPSVSPDGKQVAFAHWQVPGLRSRILLKSLGTESAVELPGDAAFEDSPTWSPEGDRLAYLRCEVASCGIFLQSWPGENPRQVARIETPSPSALSWSPDGRSIVFSDRQGRGRPFRLYRASLEDGRVEVLTRLSESASEDLQPRVSPDGSRVAFVRGDLEGGSERGLFGVLGHVMSGALEGGEVEELTPEVEELFGVAWLPTGEGVVYVARSADGRFELRRKDLGDHSPGSRVLFRSQEALRNPVVTRLGLVVVEMWRGDRDLWGVDLSTGETTPLFQSTRQDREPIFSPDRSRIAFVSSRTGSPELWLADRGTQALHRLTEFGGPPLLTPRWSPDGGSLAFVARAKNRSELYRVSVGSLAPPARILSWEGSAMVSSWSRDGRWIYLGSNRAGAWRVWRVDAERGSAEAVTPADSITAFELADGSGGAVRLLYSGPSRDGVWETVLGTDAVQQERLLLPELRSFDQANWGVADSGVYYAVRDGLTQALTVRLWVPATGEDLPIAALPWLPPDSKTVSLSNDASELVYSGFQDLNADLVAVPLEP